MSKRKSDEPIENEAKLPYLMSIDSNGNPMEKIPDLDESRERITQDHAEELRRSIAEAQEAERAQRELETQRLEQEMRAKAEAEEATEYLRRLAEKKRLEDERIAAVREGYHNSYFEDFEMYLTMESVMTSLAEQRPIAADLAETKIFQEYCDEFILETFITPTMTATDNVGEAELTLLYLMYLSQMYGIHLPQPQWDNAFYHMVSRLVFVESLDRIYAAEHLDREGNIGVISLMPRFIPICGVGLQRWLYEFCAFSQFVIEPRTSLLPVFMSAKEVDDSPDSIGRYDLIVKSMKESPGITIARLQRLLGDQRVEEARNLARSSQNVTVYTAFCILTDMPYLKADQHVGNYTVLKPLIDTLGSRLKQIYWQVSLKSNEDHRKIFKELYLANLDYHKHEPMDGPKLFTLAARAIIDHGMRISGTAEPNENDATVVERDMTAAKLERSHANLLRQLGLCDHLTDDCQSLLIVPLLRCIGNIMYFNDTELIDASSKVTPPRPPPPPAPVVPPVSDNEQATVSTQNP